MPFETFEHDAQDIQKLPTCGKWKRLKGSVVVSCSGCGHHTTNNEHTITPDGVARIDIPECVGDEDCPFNHPIQLIDYTALPKS